MEALLDADRLFAIADSQRNAYATAQPFPHAVIDGLLPDDVLDRVVAEFEDNRHRPWTTFDDEAQVGKTALDSPHGDMTRALIAEMNGPHFANFLERLTNVKGVIPDPHLVGGGLHEIRSGGLLKIHADFNKHPRTRLDRRLNVLVYLNRDWRSEWGGALELWDQDMSRAVVSVLPEFNRCVVFSTTTTSYHGHPDPLACPNDVTRKSLAFYYYSAPSDTPEHGTLFQFRDNDDYTVPTPGRPSIRARVRSGAKRWLPPVIADRLKRH